MNTPAEQVKPAEKQPETKPAEATPAAKPGAVASASFMERMTGKRNTAPAATASAAPEKKVEPKTPETPKTAATETVKPSARKKPAVAPMVIPPPEIDAEAIASAAATAAVAAVAKSNAVNAEPKAPAKEIEDDGMDQDERETIAVLDRMEKDFGDTYKGLPKRYAESLKKAKQYQADWEAKHAGQKFDPEDDEHNDFFAANEVDWRDMDFHRAIARMENDKSASKANAKDSEEKNRIAAENRFHQARPAITQRRRETAKVLFSAFGDDYKAVINEDGSVNGAEVKRLIEEDPLREIAFNSANNAELFAEELYALSNALVKFDESKPNHKFIADFVSDQENLMLGLPEDKRVDERGRRFATAEQYSKMTPARQQYFWRFNDKDISDLYAEHEAAIAKKTIAAEENRSLKVAERRGMKKIEPAANGGEQQSAPAAAAIVPVEKPVSPAGTIAPREAQPASGSGANGQSSSKGFTERWLGK